MGTKVYPSETQIAVRSRRWNDRIYFDFGSGSSQGQACWSTTQRGWVPVIGEVGERQKQWLKRAYNLDSAMSVE